MDPSEDTLDDSVGIIGLAIQHNLLTEVSADQIRDHAAKNNMSMSDSAVSMGLIPANQYEALRHLQRPKSLSPDYHLNGLVGVGANGIVFRATQVKLNREVALKTINASRLSDSSSLKRIQREATVIAGLSHPNIVVAHDCGFHNNHFYIAMELVQGQDLLSYIKERGIIPEQECWLLVRQIALALDYASQSDLIHRDIKPANVLVTKSSKSEGEATDLPVCKVVDFGLAYQTANTESSKLTAKDSTLGTPSYVAPEQLTNTSVDLRADIFSLGATAFHMLSGYPPFAKSTMMRTIVAKTTGSDAWRKELNPLVSDESSRLVMDMTESDPENRIQDYANLIERIDQIVSSSGNDDHKTTEATQRPDIGATDSRWKITGGLIAGLLVIACGWYLLQSLAGGNDDAASPVSLSALDYVRTGHSTYLFNGEETPLYGQSGLWIPTTGIEGGVLKGEENAWIHFPLAHEEITTPAAELELGVILPDESVAVLELPPDENGKNWIVRLGDGQAAVVSADETETLGEQVEFRSNAQSPIKRVQILRIENELTVLFRGQPLTTINCTTNRDTTIRLVAKNGSLELADIMLTGLAEP